MHDAWVAWETALDDDPSEHDAWYGYAEFRLFLGREEDYLRSAGLVREVRRDE